MNCFIAMEPKKKYKQKFRKEWKLNPKLKNWIREDKDVNRAYCRFCKFSMLCKLCDLLTHAKSKKHLKNMEERTSAQYDLEEQVSSEALPYISRKTALNEPNPKRKRFEKSNGDPEKFTEIILPIAIECADDSDESADVAKTSDDEDDTELSDKSSESGDNMKGVPLDGDLCVDSIILKQLQEERMKTVADYYNRKAEYFAKLTENSKIHKTILTLRARKMQLEIKRLNDKT